MTKYRIETIADLLKVPADRRAECLHQIDLTLSFFELEYGDDGAVLTAVTWTDDGEMHVSDPATGLTLTVTRESA